ncbi:GTPase-activating protein, partial [Entomortierella chlamydospora]
MMVNQHSSFAPQDDQDYDLIDGYGATSDAEPNSGHGHLQTRGSFAKAANQSFEEAAPIKNSRNSWEENDSDDDPYPADSYTYGRDDSDDDDADDNSDEEEHKEDSHNASNRESQRKAIGTFDQGSDDERPQNRNLFRTSSSNPRASINSNRSYSSHTKHHSFGYGDDRPEPSESESNSESESDQDETFIDAPLASAPFIPSVSRPSSIQSASNTFSKPGSPTLTRSAVAGTSSIEPESKKANDLTASSPPTPSSATATATPLPINSTNITSPAAKVEAQLPEQARPLLPNTSDQAPGRASGSESDNSNSSNSHRSPLTNSHSRNTSRSGIFPRSISTNAVSSRGPVNGLLNAQNRGSSYSDLSDAELNEVSLDDNSAPGTPRRSFGSTVATPRAPVAASNAGFPSSFFGGKPHPKSQQFQQQQQQQSGVISPRPLASATATPLLQSPVTSTPETRPNGVLNGSISSIASSIQGAFMGRGFGGSSNSALPPPPPVRTPSGSSSTRPSLTSMRITTNNVGIDLRSSNNISPERASTFSTMTTDSNMDLLLARLEAENSMLEQDTKRRLTTDSEMDRALGHAKEESPEEDVDWDYWGALMHDYNGVVKKNPKQLTQMIQKGIPPALRGLIWQLLAKSKDAQLEATYAELLKSTSTHEKQINRDMNRTFPNHEYFQAEGLGQESMFNVVKAYSLYDKEVGYCQGLSFVVGPLLLN